MTWWILIDDGSSIRSARGRRRVWRAAVRAAEEARGGDGVQERRPNVKPKGQRGKKRKESQTRGCSENTVHTVLHLLASETAAATAAAATRGISRDLFVAVEVSGDLLCEVPWI